MKRFTEGLMTGVLAMCATIIYTNWNEPTPEYTLELINQDTVLIRNAETGREYTVRYEQIVETLENDNL